MPTKVHDLLTILQDIAPASLAESWDNVGLLVGSPDTPVTGLLIGLDPCSAVIDEAISNGCNLIITHHPVIFRPLKAVHTHTFPGNVIARAMQHNIALIGCHTNLDATSGGVSDILGQALGLGGMRPLIPNQGKSDCLQSCGLGRIGTCATPMSAEAFVSLLYNALSPPWLLEAGLRPNSIETVAVCGGSCGDFAETALQQGADVFITAEIKHSVARWAEEAGLWLIDGGHFATEQPAVPVLGKRLQKEFDNLNISLPICFSRQAAPLSLVMPPIISTPESP
ncbi:Nif3-like dinuclear metal center hexameric protein [Desulfogranum japonicum]|uniref:Nif3-like dinuclear metal center hexameric protein n=1 Tax=Desulfogranum japonicum TaxID=231447 RepID=UPI00040FDDC7|nr:Nif3-like dinuclear metal center hexameric protein [Desulfogranum japonicum]